jgi:hypothetical protein
MHWKEQPYKGLLFFIAAFVVTWVWLAVTGVLGIDYLDAGMNWTFSWFFFGFGILAFFEGWPFVDMVKQPWAGFISGAIAWVVSILGWIVVNTWLGMDGAYALFSYASFFLFTIAWFYHNEPFPKLSQPTKGIALFLLSGVLGYMVYLILGPRDWEYLYYIPQWLFAFFLDWPIPSDKPYLKGTFWAILILIGMFVTHAIFNALGMPIVTPRGVDLFSLLFVGMLFFYALESWPFVGNEQPVQGALLIVSVLILSVVAYPILFSVLKIADYATTVWTFASWCWFAVLAMFTDPWPSESVD